MAASYWQTLDSEAHTHMHMYMYMDILAYMIKHWQCLKDQNGDAHVDI